MKLLLLLKSLLIVGLYSSNCLIAMDQKHALESQLLQEEQPEDAIVQIERTINDRESNLPEYILKVLSPSLLPEICTIITDYASLSEQQKKQAIQDTRFHMSFGPRSKEVFDKVLVEQGEFRRPGEVTPYLKSDRICCGACGYWLGLACLIIFLTDPPSNPCHNFITMDSSWNNTCWKQIGLSCCYNYETDVGGAVAFPVYSQLYGDLSIFPNPLPENHSFPLGEAVLKIVQNGPCFISDAVCPEFINCNEVDKTSATYYKNFNPCKGSHPIPPRLPKAVKQSTLARKIAMARDKQKRSKAHKNKKV